MRAFVLGIPFVSLVNNETKKVTLTNTSTGVGSRYFWYFGDGAFSTAKDTVHEYS